MILVDVTGFIGPWIACATVNKPPHSLGVPRLEMNSKNTCECVQASLNRVIIGSGNALWPVRRQAITWTNADLL